MGSRRLHSKVAAEPRPTEVKSALSRCNEPLGLGAIRELLEYHGLICSWQKMSSKAKGQGGCQQLSPWSTAALSGHLRRDLSGVTSGLCRELLGFRTDSSLLRARRGTKYQPKTGLEGS